MSKIEHELAPGALNSSLKMIFWEPLLSSSALHFILLFSVLDQSLRFKHVWDKMEQESIRIISGAAKVRDRSRLLPNSPPRIRKVGNYEES